MAEPLTQLENSPAGPGIYRGKRLGIMQPYFFPYLGYFGLIANTDRWIVFDGVQYIRKGWMNRNRVLKAGGGEKFVGITIASQSLDTLIRDTRLAADPDRFDGFARQLDAYKLLRAPHYRAVMELLRDCFDTPEDELAGFLSRCLDRTCAYLGIPFRFEIFSQMDIKLPDVAHPMEWSLYICEALGAAAYINPPGGREFFDARRFKQSGIDFYFYEQDLPAYDQKGAAFIPGLSIIDVMMFNPVDAIRDMLRQHRLCET